MTDKETLIDKIIREKLIINKANLEYCAKNETINGFLLQSIREAMQAYHESKLRESKIVESFERENQYVTDEDIQAWALKRVIIDMQPKSRINTASENAYKRGLIEAATAMRDGKIKPVSRDNDR